MSSEPSSTVPAAEFGSRFSAFMIDAAILFGAQWTIFIVLSRQLQAAGLTSTEPCVPNGVELCEGPSTPLWILLLAFLLLSTVGYHAFFEGRYGATPGKQWMNLVVVNDRDEWPISPVSALVRSVVRQAFWLVLFFVFDVSPFGVSLPAILFILLPVIAIGMLALGAIAPDSRAVHDHLAGTRVVRMDQASTRKVESIVPDADITTSPSDAPTGDPVRSDPEDSV